MKIKFTLVMVVVGLMAVQALRAEDVSSDAAWNLYHSKQYIDALSNFKKITTANANDAEALRGMAYCEFKLGRYLDAITHAKASQKINSNLPPVQEKITLPGVEGEFEIKGSNESLIGWSYYLLGDSPRAVSILSQVVNKNTSWVAARHGLGLAYMYQGKLSEAKKQFEEIKKIDPKYAAADIGLTTVGAMKTAQTTYTKLKSVYDGWNLLNIGKYKEAVAKFNGIIQNKSIPKGEMWRAHLGLGWAEYWLGQVASAKTAFDKVVNERSDIVSAYKGLAFCAFKNKNYDKVISLLNRYLEEIPGDTEAITNIAWSHYQKKEYAQATENFSKVATSYPLMAEPHMGLTLCHYEAKNTPQAKESFLKAIQLYPWYVDSPMFQKMLQEQSDWKKLYTDIGWSFYTQADYKKALIHFEKAGNPKEILNAKGLAFSNWQLAKNDEAIRLLHELLERSLTKDEKLEIVNTLGWSYYNKTQYNDAIHAFDQGLKLYDTAMESLRGLGWSYYRKKDFQNAISYFEKLTESYPLLADAHNGLGWAYFSKNNFTKSADAFDRCLLLLPGHYEAQVGLSKINKNFSKLNEAWYFYSIGDLNKAKARFTAVMPKLSETEKWRAHLGLGWTAYFQGQTQKALAIFKDKVLTQKPDEPMALKGVGFAHYIMGQYAEALPYLEKFAGQFPLSSEGQGYLSWAALRAGNVDDAVKYFTKFAEKYPYAAEAQGGLAITYFKLGKNEEAHEAMLKAVNLSSVIANLPDYQDMLEAHTDWSDVYAIAGWGYLNSFYYAEAEKYFNLALAKDSENLDTLRGLGFVHFYLGTYEKAKDIFSKIAPRMTNGEKTWGKKSAVLSALGWSYFYTGDHDQSIQTFEQLAKVHEDDSIYADPFDGMGWNYLKLRKYEQAKEAFDKALSLAPLYASPKRGLASVYEEMQKK